tara:strand:+ start:883 stop:1137 length:255 start_codon:yes stop_codon:yes gene_type:complete
MDSLFNGEANNEFLIIFIVPFMLYKGYIYNDNELIFLSFMLFFLYLYYIIYSEPNIMTKKENILRPLPLEKIFNNEITGNIFIN